MKVLTFLFIGLLTVFLSFLPTPSSAEPTGLVSMKSAFSVEQTTKRLEGLLKKRNLNLFAQVDHTAGAKSVGLKLRPTRLLIFGNPRSGTPLMQCGQSVAIDLPMKALVWEDEAGQVWVGYNSPNYLKTRHRLKGCDQVLEKTSQALNSLAKAATQP
ncbi:DUF302 domain-containing protein [Fortiea sp. LEGE XX443]|uniref:DUF302 domain-containing protein n=1 Tax=Fortiea sp. LEGE XX443 TaxID=1828611 RepID=UPI001881F1DF|nr:DUF302 domain-containing protein [Fortiea sp. LEGE XX443]MBE9005797.1 DUF302 domain-containing protein [Fortiea sp. LEGE XX443]